VGNIAGIHKKLGMGCRKCGQTRALIVDRAKPSSPIPVERDINGTAIRTEPCFPVYMHKDLCEYHLEEHRESWRPC